MSMLHEDVFRDNLALLEKLVLYRLEDIEERVGTIRNEFGLPFNETRVPYHTPKEYDALLEKARLGMRQFRDRHKGFPTGFRERIEGIRKTTGLGREWNITLYRFTVTGILLPPPFSIYVEDDKENKTLTFETNKHTTRDDLLHAWDFYENERLELFGKTKAHHVSKKEAAKVALIKQLEVTKKKEGLSDKEVAAYLTPEEELLDDEDLGKADKRGADWLKKNRERFKKEVTN